MAKRILHATDFSSASRPAFRHAMMLAKLMKHRLIIAHVLTPPIALTGDLYVSPQIYLDVERSLRAAAEKRLGRMVAIARTRGVRAGSLVLEGVAHDQIARGARVTRAGMIVIGTHGRTGLTRLVLGSVASRVLATAPCPVLTVRGA